MHPPKLTFGRANQTSTVGNGTLNGTSMQELDLYLENHYFLMLITALVIGCAALIGTLGNVLMILAVCCVRVLRTSGNIFVLNLALADMVVTLLVDPFNVVGAVAGRSVLMGNETLCSFLASFCGPACLSSMWNMCAISINRYFYICKPHLYPRIFTIKSSILCCVGIWILAHLLTMPNHIGWGKNRFIREYYICTFDSVTHSYGIFYIVTGVLIPLVGVLYGYTAIFIKVRAVKLQIRQYRQTTVRRRASDAIGKRTSTPLSVQSSTMTKRPDRPGFNADDVKLAQTLFAAFLTFLISWSLVVFLTLAHNPPEAPGWLYVTGVIMAHGNSAVNPILYGLANEKFREGYRSVLGWKHPTVGPAEKPTKKSGTPSLALVTDCELGGKPSKDSNIHQGPCEPGQRK